MRLLTPLVLLLLLAACAPSTPVVRPDPVNDANADIEALVQRGDFAAAAERWQARADETTDSRQANRFRLQAALAWLKDGQPDRAETSLPDERHLSPDQLVDYNLLRAELALVRGDLAEAGWRLAAGVEGLDREQANRHSRLEAMLAERRDDPAREALSALEQAIADGDFEPALALALLIEQPQVALERLLRQQQHRAALRPWLDLALTARRHLLDPVAVDRALIDWQGRHPAVGYSAADAADWLTLWRQSWVGPRHLAVLLPGEGPLRAAGDAVASGLLDAWFELPPNQRPALDFLRIDNTADAAVAGWFDARERGADFIIGPLERSQVDTLSELPSPGVPMLMLNHPSDQGWANRLAPGLHAFGLVPEEEAELLAVRALMAGHQRVLVLFQDSDWGERVAGQFANTFRLGGGQIVDQARYNASQVDHSALLEVVLELDQSSQRAQRLSRLLGQPLESEPQRRTDIDLVFLAAREQDGRLIRPQLRFFGAGELPLMATSQIIAGAPDARRDEDLDGLYLTLPPWFLDDHSAGARRVQAERDNPGIRNPNLSRLHAMGMDAFDIARWMSLLQADADLYLAGRTGLLRIPGDARLERDLPLVQLRQGRPVLVQ
ncbi:MAG: penicillin-binding protein activator [Wenzhouxiangella sp.]